MPNINLALEIEKCRAAQLVAFKRQAEAHDEVLRLEGRIAALTDLVALVDSGKGNEAEPPVPVPDAMPALPDPEAPAPFSVIEGSGAAAGVAAEAPTNGALAAAAV